MDRDQSLKSGHIPTTTEVGQIHLNVEAVELPPYNVNVKKRTYYREHAFTYPDRSNITDQ